MDKIYIRDLALRCIIGVYPEERREKQDLVVNVTMGADLQKAGETDRLRDTVDYKKIKQQIVAFVEESRFELIEAIAEGIADLCLKDKKIRNATVTIDKPGALRFARSAAVEINRRKSV